MRLQFSIVTLLSLTAYAAMFSAAAADISSIWLRVLVYAVPLLFLTCLGVALFSRGNCARFARGFAVGSCAYVAVALLCMFAFIPAPHDWIRQSLPRPPFPADYDGDYDAFDFGVFVVHEIFAGSQCVLMSGILFGLFARRFYRFLEAPQ
jgi:hypothetical protein